MADNKVRLPQSGGGLVNYYEDYKAKTEFSPWIVVAIIAIIIVIEIAIQRLNILGF